MVQNTFSLALFEDGDEKVAIDAMGKLAFVGNEDWDQLTELAGNIEDLPKTSSFRNANTWKVEQPKTCHLIDRLIIPSSSSLLEVKLVETSVSGYSKSQRHLSKPVGEITELPDILYTLFGLVIESREGLTEGEEDNVVVDKVREVFEGSAGASDRRYLFEDGPLQRWRLMSFYYLYLTSCPLLLFDIRHPESRKVNSPTCCKLLYIDRSEQLSYHLVYL